MPETKRDDLVWPELSFKIVAVLFEVYKELGGVYQEKIYQRAVANELEKRGFVFEEQVIIPLQYKGENIGSYVLDFLIDNKVVLEIKKDKNFSRTNITQVHSYLRATGLQLGILGNFTAKGVRFKRIVNII